MGDGHTGISHRYTKEVKTDKFHLALSYVKTQDIGGFFVVHIVPRATSDTVRLNEVEFLEMLRFKKHNYACEPFDKQCWYRYVFETEVDGYDWDVTSMADERFETFAQSIDEAFSRAQQLIDLVGHKFDLFPWAEQFRTLPKVLESLEAEPGWLTEWRVGEHEQVLNRLRDDAQKSEHFKTIEYCLWGTGDELVDSVQYILSEMDLKAQKTRKGATVDLILRYPPENLDIGIEVTGLSGAIKKASNKITQALGFIQQCEDSCKAIILANTYNDMPLLEREGLEHFSEPAAIMMAANGIVGVTTMDLYRIWKDVRYGGADINAIIGEMVDHEGGIYEYHRSI